MSEQRLFSTYEQAEPFKQEDFRLVLPRNALKDPESGRGSVVAAREVAPLDEHGDNLPEKVRAFEILVKDPFVDADPDTYREVNDYIGRMEEAARIDGLDVMSHRTEATCREEWNQYTQAWLADPSVESAAVWRGNVPSALALHYLTNPTVGTIITNRFGEKSVISKETAAQLRFVEDGIGIRDRGVAMSALVEDHFIRTEEPLIDVLSLASGTAEPVFAAARCAIDDTNKCVSMTVADIDDEALKLVSQNAERYGLDDVSTVRANILNPELADLLEQRVGKRQYDVVENMGFEEYLPQDGDTLGAFKGVGLPQASEFTRNAFKLVKPGGVLISGNMVLDRPQRDYVFGIVDWPLINARSEKEILNVYKQAGILDNPNAQVDMVRVINEQTGTHLYNIMRVNKLA